MAEIINLNRARKTAKAAAAQQQAAANRMRHGRSKAAKQNDDRAEARREALLDGARRDEAGQP